MHQRRGHHDDRDDRHRHHDHRHRDDDRRHHHHHASPSGRAQQSQQSRHRDSVFNSLALSRSFELVCCELPFRWPFPLFALCEGGVAVHHLRACDRVRIYTAHASSLASPRVAPRVSRSSPGTVVTWPKRRALALRLCRDRSPTTKAQPCRSSSRPSPARP